MDSRPRRDSQPQGTATTPRIASPQARRQLRRQAHAGESAPFGRKRVPRQPTTTYPLRTRSTVFRECRLAVASGAKQVGECARSSSLRATRERSEPRSTPLPGREGRFELDDFLPRKMHLVGQLSNPSSGLDCVLGAQAPKRSSTPNGATLAGDRLRNGAVKRAIIKVLTTADGPMRGSDIHLAVERLLGCTVSKNSVSWSLAANVHGTRPCFERISYGRYQRAPQS